jgi:ubiquinone/menaquinone biosynthesis C-methylase UbiE
MEKIVSWMDKKLYPQFEKNWDDRLFGQEILNVLQKNYRILDLGAGAGIVTAMNFRGQVEKVCGIDMDERVLKNPYLDEAKMGNAENIFYPDQYFDLVFANNVFEHLADPGGVLKEINRVLKPGGYFFFKTPNKWHYMPLIAQMTPHRFHQFVNRKRGRLEVDTFPTLYRINSPAKIKYYANANQFTVKFIKLVEGRPEYLRINPLTYLLGALYERIVNATELFFRFRIVSIACLEKKLD